MSCRVCGKKARAKGLCPTCYQRQRRREMGVKEAVDVGDAMAITVLLPAYIHMDLELKANRQNTTKSAIVRELLGACLGQNKNT